MYGVKISGIGIALPDRVVTNDDIARILIEQRKKVIASGYDLSEAQMKEYETSHEWILSHIGINQRRFAEPSETTSDYAVKAGDVAWIDAYGEGLQMPDFLLLATVSPDHFTTPATSVITHRKMGIPVYCPTDGKNKKPRRLIARDITQACTSLMTAFQDGCSLIRSGDCQRGLVIGADVMTRVMSWNKRSPFVILADAGGAFVLESIPEEESWFGPNAFFAGVNGGKNGEFESMIINRAGGAKLPTALDHLDPRVDEHLMFMNGNAVYKKIVPMVANEIIPAALDYTELKLQDIDVLILHQANLRMTEGVVDRLLKANPNMGIRMATYNNPDGELWLPKKPSVGDEERNELICYNNIEHLGNTTSPSIPLSVFEARELGIIKPGKRVMLLAFGGGFSWCSAIIEWGGRHLPEFNK